MSPLVSIVITVYNRESYLAAAIESVLNQSWSEFELLIWDDGSCDRSLEIARSFAQQDARVRVVAAAHQGRVPALQAAIAQTSGQFLCWVDSDDVLAPTALAETVAHLRANPAVGMVYTDYLDIDAQGAVLGYGDRCRIPYSPERLLVDFMTFHFRLIRRSVFDQVGGIDGSLNYVEDYDLCLRLSEATEIQRLQKPLYYYRNHDGNASHQWRIEQVLRARTVIRRALKRRHLDDQFELQVQLLQGRFILRRKSRPLQPTAWITAASVVAAPLAIALAPIHTAAQSITPAADGTGTIVTPAGNQFNITGGRLSGNGANLFQSFQQFGLPQGQIANFLTTPQIQNVLGRVVGGSPSVINGLIRVSGSNANLFLLNPAGIVFGPTASLNVPGSFLATTANGVGFNCSSTGAVCTNWFNAIGTNDYASLVGNPAAFAFTMPQPGAIVNAGNLAVAPGRSLTLLGGVVVNTGSLTAPAGQITLTAVPGSTLVRLSQPGSLLNLEFVPQLPTSAAPVAPLAYTPQTLPQLLTGGNLSSATRIAVNPNGTIQLSGSAPIPMSAGTAIASGTLTTAIPTPNLTSTSAINILGRQVGVIGAQIDASSPGNGGNVRIGGEYRGQGRIPNATQTYVDANSTIRADSLLNGNGGRVIVWADDTTRFFGNITARGGTQAGNGGFVEVSGKNNLTFRGNVDVTAANGLFGTLLLDPTTLTIIDAAAGSGSFDATLPNIFAATPDLGANTVSWGQLATLPTGTAIRLEASGDITFAPITGVAGGGITTAAGVANLNPLGGTTGKSLTVTSTGGSVSFANPANTIATNGGAVTISGTSLNLGTIDTSRAPIVVGNGGNMTLSAIGNIVTADLIGNGYGLGYGAPPRGGDITVSSATGSITTGAIRSTSISPFFASNGGSVNLTTSTNGGNITFTSIDVRGVNGVGGNVTIAARGLVRGTGTIPTLPTSTIATNGEPFVSITHDGGPDNIPFSVGLPEINGLVGNITAGIDVVTGTFPLGTPLVTSPTGFVQIAFSNTAPTLTANSPLTGGLVNQPFTFTYAQLNPIRFDANADNPNTVQVAAIAPGAILRINGIVATPGSLLLPGAVLQFVPPPNFIGTLTNAIVLRATESNNPIAVTKGVDVVIAPPVVNSCLLTNTCTPPAKPPDNPGQAALKVDNPTPEDRFSQQFESYLGLRPVAVKSIEEQQQILQGIERDAGVKPAIVYISFVPELLRFGNSNEEADTDQLELMIVTPQGNPVRKRFPQITRASLLPLAQRFRNEVSDPRKTRATRYLGMAQQLYQILITPLLADLQARQINNLVFVMDSGLRSLPIAALHNGQSFLIEQYSVGVMPSFSLTDTRYQDIRGVRVLGMGISESTQDQPPLPAVPVEVSNLVQQWSGREAFNTDVTLANLKAFRREQPFGIIHLATHANFQPGAIRNSYIQLWDDKLRLNQVNQLGWSNPQIELLVLSACATALGDREAELGFGGLAVQTGVKTAVASLWYVSDDATTALMTEFYRNLLNSRVKTQALRQAQLALAKGDVTVIQGRIRGPAFNHGIPLPVGTGVRDRALTHPYYWAAFTMIGSPW